MHEFLIHCPEDDWNLSYDEWSDVFHPNSIPYKRLPGIQYRINVDGCPIYFADESPGIHVCVDGKLPEVVIQLVVKEVFENLQRLTGQRGKIVDLGSR